MVRLRHMEFTAMQLFVATLLASLAVFLMDISWGDVNAPPVVALPSVGVAHIKASDLFRGHASVSDSDCTTHPSVRSLDNQATLYRSTYQFSSPPGSVDGIAVRTTTRFYRHTDRRCSGAVLAEITRTGTLTMQANPQQVNMHIAQGHDSSVHVTAYVHRLTLTTSVSSQQGQLQYPAGATLQTTTVSYLACILEQDLAQHKTVIALIPPTEKTLDLRRALVMTVVP